MDLSFTVVSAETFPGVALFSAFVKKWRNRSGFQDRYSLPLATQSAQAADAYRLGVDRVFAVWGGAVPLLQEAVALDPEFAAAHLALGIAHFENSSPALGQASLIRADALKERCSLRERRQIEAVSIQRAGWLERGIELMESHLEEFPRDALVMDELSRMLFLNGGADKGDKVIALMRKLSPAYADDWFFLAKFGFYLEETGHLDEARAILERSLQLNSRNAHAVHAWVHLLLQWGKLDEAYTFLQSWVRDYDEQGRFHEHFWNHLSLVELDRGQPQRARETYEARSRLGKNVGAKYLTLADAAGFSWRHFMYSDPASGATSGLSWAGEVCRLGAELTRVSRQPYVDVHAAMAFAAERDHVGLRSLIQVLERDAESSPERLRPVIQVCRGLLAFVSGKYDEAAAWLGPQFSASFECMGGSLAEREPLEEAYVLALLHSRNWTHALSALERLLFRRRSARLLFWSGKAKLGAGDRDGASCDFAEALERWQDAEDTSERRELERELNELRARVSG